MRKPQVKLTVIFKNRYGYIIPQVILVPGETTFADADEAIRTALSEQSVLDDTYQIVKVTYMLGI